tara:strand:- start:768 stop:1295 length:528 start_codon:yes stop_codon:yes gene_type:complete
MYLNKIKIFLQINICLIFFSLVNIDVKSEEIKVISGIAKVIDGDTLRIDKKKIRLFGIDAPEKKQQCRRSSLSISFLTFGKDYPCGQISADRLRKKINDKLVICKYSSKDRYKRFIAECFLNKTNINAWMVQTGHAVAYKKYSKKFVAQEIFAKKEKLGLWSGTFEMPWNWRKNR